MRMQNRTSPLPQYRRGGDVVHCLGIGCAQPAIPRSTPRSTLSRRSGNATGFVAPRREIEYPGKGLDPRHTPDVGGYTMSKNRSGQNRMCCPSCGPGDPCRTSGWYDQ